MRRPLRLFRKVFLYLFFLAALIELGSLGFYYVQKGGFFYASGRAPFSVMAEHFQVAEAVFHPYLSFLNRVGRKGDWWGTNNHGWQATKTLLDQDPHCCDVPYQRRSPRELLVGVFGGSVGSGYALIAQKTGGLGEALQAVPAFQGRPVTVLNFGMSAYKQPQQLLALSYYLSLGQKFDLIINVDGFNETVTSHQNWKAGVDPTYPADVIWGAMGRQLERTAPALQSANLLASSYHEYAAREEQQGADRCEIATCYAVHSALSLYHRLQAAKVASTVVAASNNYTLFPAAHEDPAGPISDIASYTADRWVDSSRFMRALAKSNDAIYLHILQPNQWYKPSGDYDPIDQNHPYQWIVNPVNDGYGQFRERIPKLIEAGVPVLDGSFLFKGMDSRAVYIDDCCHYTDFGYDILFKATARAVQSIIEDNTSSGPTAKN